MLPVSFLVSLPPDGAARDAFLLDAIAADRIDAPTWVRVAIGDVELEVSSDYLTIEGEHVPMTAAVAQAAVDSLDALLPTPAVVDAIERVAAFVPLPTWAPPAGQSREAQTSSAIFDLCERRTRAAFEARGIQPGQLVAGHRKDVVLAPSMPVGYVVIYGARWPDRRRLQPIYAGHGDWYEDYSHGVRAVRRRCRAAGEEVLLDEVIQRAPLGPVARVRYSAAHPIPVVSPATATHPTLRRGSVGSAVEEAQGLLVANGAAIDVDGIFGPATESAVRAFQAACGLALVDGVIGPSTWAALERATNTPPPTERAPLPFVQARNFYTGRRRSIRAIVLHTMEAAEKPTTAENVAAWFAGPNAPMASAHFCVDSDSIVQCVRESDTAFAAPGLNADGIQIEMAGYAAQGADGWADAYSTAMLELAAGLVAELAARWSLPVRFVDAAGLLRGEEGITTHAEVTKAYRESTHTDPGPTFPMTLFLQLAERKGGG